MLPLCALSVAAGNLISRKDKHASATPLTMEERDIMNTSSSVTTTLLFNAARAQGCAR